MLVRALKLMDFQPYLGVVTRSLSMAALSLIHFFILAFLIFFVFSIFAFAVFGDIVPQVQLPAPGRKDAAESSDRAPVQVYIELPTVWVPHHRGLPPIEREQTM